MNCQHASKTFLSTLAGRYAANMMRHPSVSVGAPHRFWIDSRPILTDVSLFGRGRGTVQNWPAGSPDVRPTDFYMWGQIKNIVYDIKVDRRDALLQRIHDASGHMNGLRISYSFTFSPKASHDVYPGRRRPF